MCVFKRDITSNNIIKPHVVCDPLVAITGIVNVNRINMMPAMKTIIKKTIEVLLVLALVFVILSMILQTIVAVITYTKVNELFNQCDGTIELVQWKYGCFYEGVQTSCQVVQCIQN